MEPSEALPANQLDFSVVCPFYNEAGIIEQTVRAMLQNLGRSTARWELIVVNDGSTDGSERLVEQLALESPNLRVLGYAQNRGRGYALRVGIAAARGAIIVTTEIDLSWGEDIVHRLVSAMHAWPDAHIVIASPHLEGGGYRNVPPMRVWLSLFGNMVIRTCLGHGVSMNTGMTRAYRRNVIHTLPLFENGKEFHLDVILKAVAFGLDIREIPAVLEWKDYRRDDQKVQRKSSSKVNRLIVSHTLFSLLANPVRYVWAAALFILLVGLLSFVAAVFLYVGHQVSVYMAMLSVLLVTLSLLVFILGVVVKQSYVIQREIWTLQRLWLTAQAASEQPEQSFAAAQGAQIFTSGAARRR